MTNQMRVYVIMLPSFEVEFNSEEIGRIVEFLKCVMKSATPLNIVN